MYYLLDVFLSVPLVLLTCHGNIITHLHHRNVAFVMSTKPKQPIKGEYIETETGNKISRQAQVVGAKHIVLAGKCVIQAGTIIRGDLIRPPQQPKPSDNLDPKSAAAKKPSQPSSVHLGRYVFVSPNCTLHPPSRLDRGSNTSDGKQQLIYYPLRIMDYVFIGPNSNIRAAEIRSNVHIGSNVSVGNFCVIKENVRILDGAVLPAGSVWASNSVVAGAPARVVGELAEAWGGGSSVGGSTGGDELVGVRSRERWASVGNKR